MTDKHTDWRQIGGDMNPGAHGGIIARWDGDSIEIREIQPVREYVGDGEALEVGYPFWSREAYYYPSDLDPSDDDVQRALQCCGLDLYAIEEKHRPMAIAECLLYYGHCVDEGPCGWAKDVVPTSAPMCWGRLETMRPPMSESIRTELTKREMAEAIASELLGLHERDLDRAVGLDQDGDVASCYEGGRRLAVVLVSQSSDVDSYGGGEMGPEDVAAIADAFEGMWLDAHNARVHGTDEPEIEWAG